MASTDVTVPDIGDFKDVPIIEINVAVGDEVTAEQPLIVLESDKASMEVPSPQAGKVEAILVKIGDKVSQGVSDPETGGRGRRGGSPRRRTPRSRTEPPRAKRPREDRPPRRSLRPLPPPRAACRRRSTSAAPMPRRACVASRANSTSTSRRSRAPARKAASPRRT